MLSLEQLATNGYEEQMLLNHVLKMAQRYKPDWLLLADADEFFESPEGGNLKEAIEHEAARGYNLIQFHNIEFWMTEKDDPTEPDFMKRIKYYSYFYSNMYRAYKNFQGIDIAQCLGHKPIFPENIEPKVSPKIFISRHYKFRSVEQGRKKIRRVRPLPNRPDQNFHYLKYTDDPHWFIIPSEKLTLYKDDHNWDLTVKYRGGRMTKEEMAKYLGLNSVDEVDEWIARKTFKPRC